MQPTLIILAAGMASRYGSMKQTEGFGPSGETIMDYSIYDAIRAGFGKVVFIIRKEFADTFREAFDKKLHGKIETAYVYQELNSFVNPDDIPAERTKPWGTGHALLCASPVVNEPFAVINADDYYGQDAFQKAADYLKSSCTPKDFAIIGYQLDKTLSDHGTVSRGVCEVDAQNHLVSITERTNIFAEDKRVFFEENAAKVEVAPTSNVSMNFWCFHPSVFTLAMNLFKEFIPENKSNLKSEFFIPIIADSFIRTRGNAIRVISTSSQWFGVTYKEDAVAVKNSVTQLVESGVYPSSLWA